MYYVTGSDVYIDGIDIIIMWPGMEKNISNDIGTGFCLAVFWSGYSISSHRGHVIHLAIDRDVTWPSWRFKSPATQLFIQLFA